LALLARGLRKRRKEKREEARVWVKAGDAGGRGSKKLVG
jgi:hypothetical protein